MIVSRIMLLGLILVFMQGCASLSDSQIQKARKLGEVTTQLAVEPNSVLEHAFELEHELELHNLTNRRYKQKAVAKSQLKRIVSKNMSIQRNRDKANEIRSSLQVVKGFGALLTRLSSDELIDHSDTAFKEAGSVLDHAATTVNEKKSENFPLIGSKVAGGIGGIFSVFWRSKRADLVKEAVVSYKDPINAVLSKSKEVVMKYAKPVGYSKVDLLKAIKSGKCETEQKIKTSKICRLATAINASGAAGLVLENTAYSFNRTDVLIRGFDKQLKSLVDLHQKANSYLSSVDNYSISYSKISDSFEGKEPDSTKTKEAESILRRIQESYSKIQ